MIRERKTRQTKSWEELTFADNFLFCKILEHDPDLCRRLKLDDRAYKVFFNAAACDTLKGDEEWDFFRFLNGEKADSVFSKSIEEKVAFAKRNMEWRRQYMTWQQTIDEAKEISFEEGARQTARETARKLLNEGDAPEKVARCCSLPLAEVLSLQAALSRETVAR